LRGGERIRLEGFSAAGPIQFDLPREHFCCALRARRYVRGPQLRLDTVVINSDDQRVRLTWRCVFPCSANSLYSAEGVVIYRMKDA